MSNELNLSLKENQDMEIPEMIDHYRIIRLILESYASVVCFGFQTDTMLKCAIKFIPIQYFEQKPDQIDILRMVKHDHIINIIDFFQYPKFVAMVMPYAIKDLFDYVVYDGPISEHITCRIIHDLLEAVNYLHSNNIWHCNITPEQVLIKEDTIDGPFIQLSGFQSAKHVNSQEITGPAPGLVNYAAYELLDFNGNLVTLKRNATYSNKIDIWSVGIIMFILLTRKTSFDIQSQKGIESMKSGEIPLDDLDGHVSDCAIDLIRNMLQFDPDERFSAAQALAHPWFNQMH